MTVKRSALRFAAILGGIVALALLVFGVTSARSIAAQSVNKITPTNDFAAIHDPDSPKQLQVIATATGGGLSATPNWVTEGAQSDTQHAMIGAAGDVNEVTWTTRASMLTPRFSPGVAAVGSKVYAVGGGLNYGTGQETAVVEEYDSNANTWRSRASMPTVRSGIGLAASQGKLYAVGGMIAPRTFFAMVEEYDPSTNLWRARAPMPTPRVAPGLATTSDGKLYAIGGQNGSGTPIVLATVEEYDPATDTWRARAPMPTPREFFMLATAGNGKLYAMGGWNEVSWLSAVEEYDPATNTWRTRASMPTPRGFGAVATGPNGKLYVVGGLGASNQTFSTVEEYDPATDSWQTLTAMPTGRLHHGMATTSNGQLYVIGGCTSNGGLPVATVLEGTIGVTLTPPPSVTPTPTPISTPSPTPISTPITWTLSYDAPISNNIGALAAYNGKLYAAGWSGQSDGRVYVYDGVSWTDMDFASQVGVGVDLIQALQVFGNRLYLGTRVNVGGTATVRVYYYDGTTFTEDFSASGAWGYSGIEDLAVHDGKLYASNGSPVGAVYQRNGDHDWVMLGGAPKPGNAARGLASYNGELYVGTGTGGNQAKLWRWTGSTWTLVKNFAADYGINQDGVLNLAVGHGKLYVGLAGPGSPSPVFVYDGAAWAISLTIDGCNYANLAGINGTVWAGSCGGRAFFNQGTGWASAGTTGDDYIAFAEYDGSIFVGTGSKGRVYRTLLSTSCIAAPGSVPADNTSTSAITLSGAPAGHQVQFNSTLPGSTFAQRTGTVDNNGRRVTTIRSTTPGTAIITAQDLTTGESFPASASVTFTSVGGQPQPPPAQTGPIGITAIRPQHPLDARYLQGIPVPNRIDVTVDWKGTAPGRVDFILNGATVSKAIGGSTANHTFDMGADLRVGSNSLRIIAVNAAGQSSPPMDFAPWSTPMPVWMVGLYESRLAALPVLASGDWGGKANYEMGFHLPPYAFDIGAPGFGVPDGETKLGFEFSGKLSIPLYCLGPFEGSLSAGAERGFKFLGAKLEGKVTGGVKADPIGLCVWESPHGAGTFKVEATRNLYRKPVLVMVAYFNAAVGVFVEQTVVVLHIEDLVAKVLGEFYVDGKARIQADSDIAFRDAFPYFQFSNLTVGGGLGIEGGYRYQLPVAEIKVWAGADGIARAARPGLITWPPTDNWTFDSITLTGEVGAKLRAGWFEREAKGSIEWKYPPTASAMASGLRDLTVSDWRLIGHTPAPDYATFRAAPVSRQAFAPRAVQLAPSALSAPAAITSVLVSNVYTYPEPSLAVQPVSGDALLLWVHDDVAKPVGQAQEIAFSRWDGNAWRAPAGVTDDDKLDGAPQVAWAASGAGVAVWQRLNATLPVTATFDVTTAKKIEIATAVYDPTLGTWSPVALLTSNASLDMTPRLAANAGGKLLAAWRQNDAGLLSGTATDGDRIVAAFYDGGWAASAVAVDGIPGLVDLAAGYGTDAATIAFTRYLTPTDSVTPTLQLFTAAWDGAAWAAAIQRTDDDLGHRNPQVAYNAADEPLMIWLAGTGQGQALSLRNLATSAVVTLTLPAEIGAIDEFRVLQDAAGNLAAVFTAQAGQRDLFVAFFDQAHGLWGNPVRLTDDRASEAYPAPGLDGDGRLLMGYAATAITPVTHTTTVPGTGEVVTYTLPTEGQTDLLTLSHTFVRNLSGPSTSSGPVLTVSDDHPAPGATVILSATVGNAGDLALTGVTVAFYDGDPAAGGTLIATRDLPEPLAAGFTATLTTPYVVPATGGMRNLYAVADPANAIAEANEADNIGHLAAFGPDLELTDAGAVPWGGSEVGLVTVIHNLGTTDSPTTTVAFYSESGASASFDFTPQTTLRYAQDAFAAAVTVVTDTLPALGAGATYTLTTPWNFGALPGGSYTVTAVVNPDQADFAEVITANNAQTLTWAVLPDPAVSPYYLWAELTPDDALSVTIAVMNWGAVAADAVPLRLMLDNPITGTVFFSETISNLPPGNQILISARLDNPPAGARTVFGWVDPERALLQARSDNDLASTEARLLPRPPTAAAIEGPTMGAPNESYTFTAHVQPVTATTPLTYTWQAAGQSAIVHTGGLSDAASFAWSATGSQTITVAAANVDGVVTATHTITIAAATPTPTATPTATSTPSPSPTATPTVTPSPTSTPTATPTATPTPTSTPAMPRLYLPIIVRGY